jgi:hypothetical protein
MKQIKTKKYTVRFYTPNDIDFGYIYKGWCYLNKDTYHNQVINWIRSGNVIMIKNCMGKDLIYSWINKSNLVLNRELMAVIKH